MLNMMLYVTYAVFQYLNTGLFHFVLWFCFPKTMMIDF